MLTAALDGPADWDALEQRWDREADLGDVAAFIEANVDDFFVDDSSA